MGSCCSSPEDERQSLIDKEGKPQRAARRPNAAAGAKSNAVAAGAGRPAHKAGAASGAPVVSDRRSEPIDSSGRAAAGDAQKSASSSSQSAIDEQQKMKSIIAKAERDFIDLQEVALAMQPPSLEDSRFFAHLDSAKVRQSKQSVFALPTFSVSASNVPIAQRLSAPSAADGVADLNLSERVEALRRATLNVKVAPKGELIAHFPGL